MFMSYRKYFVNSPIAKIENEHTKERLRFLKHVMETLLKIEGVTGRNQDGQTR